MTTLAEFMARLKSERGGTEKMEVKSRYEVVAELEEKKRRFIVERDSFPDIIRNKEKQIRDDERELEDDKEELEVFKSAIEDKKITIQELITSIDESLERFSKLDKKS